MFVNEEVAKKHDQRLKDYTDAVCMREPEHLIVGVNYHTAQFAWAKAPVQKCVYDSRYYVDSCVPFYGAYDIDLVTIPLINPLEAIWILGRDTFFISSDGYTVQYREDVPMKGDEYDQLIADPMGFITGTLLPRKFPHLAENHDASYNLLRATAEAFQRHRKANGMYIEEAKNRYGIISYNGGKQYVPFDVLLDRIRGVKDTLVDIRRQPDKVIAACEALSPYYLRPIAGLKQPVPHGFLTLHAPMFLNRKQFEKFYWPGLKETIMHAYNKGSMSWVQFQGDCAHILDYFMELPKGSVIVNLEKEDPIEVKKKYGHHIAIQAGVPMAWYRGRSKEECVDYAKRIIEECAPGGGFVFGIDSAGLSEGDLCQDKMNAVFQVVHDYRK